MQLFRAVCYAAPNIEDHHVFLEARNEQSAQLLLPHLLSLLWRVPAELVGLYNVHSEAELYRDAVGPAADGPVRLFETGHWMGPLYANADRTLLLVRPERMAELRRAQIEADVRRRVHERRDAGGFVLDQAELHGATA